jgi:hypothetical protein
VNEPVTFPLKLPPKVNPPVSVTPVPKHALVVVKLKFATTRPVLPDSVSDVVKPKTGLFPESSKVAVQFPLIDPLLPGLFDIPQADRISASAMSAAIVRCLILKYAPQEMSGQAGKNFEQAIKNIIDARGNVCAYVAYTPEDNRGFSLTRRNDDSKDVATTEMRVTSGLDVSECRIRPPGRSFALLRKQKSRPKGAAFDFPEV